MTIMGVTPQGLLFTSTVLAAFGWGIGMGLLGAFAPAPPNRDGAHAPGAAGTHDRRLEAEGKDRSAA